MVRWNSVVQVVKKHTDEFNRLHKCLNKDKVPKSPTKTQHLDNIINEYNSLTNIFNNYYPDCTQSHKLEIDTSYNALRTKLDKLFIFLNIKINIPTSFSHILVLNPPKPPPEEKNSYDFDFDFDNFC